MKKTMAILFIGLLTLPFFVSYLKGDGEEWCGLKEGAYYVWRAKLQVFDPSIGEFRFYWSADHFLKIFKAEKSENILKTKVAFSTRYVEINSSRYTDYDTGDRTINHRNGGLMASYDLSINRYVILFVKENWGFLMDFPFSPYAIYNTKARGFKQFLESEYIVGPIAGMVMKRGILFETWDIVLGTRREVYYMEIYFRTLDLNINETAIDKNSITEANIEIDKELGVVLSLRYFWTFADKQFEITVDLSDTNMFGKHRFTMTVISVIAALVIIGLAIRHYRSIQRKKLIRI